MATTAGPVAVRFGENLQRCRRRAGLSQTGFAAATDLHRTEIGHLEQGRRRPRIDTLIKVASVLEVPVGELLDGIHWVQEGSARGSFRIGIAQQAPDDPGVCSQKATPGK